MLTKLKAASVNFELSYNNIITNLIDKNFITIDETVTDVSNISLKGGKSEADKLVNNLIENILNNYQPGLNKNDIYENELSNLSPYLHYGQISSLEIAQLIENSNKSSKEQKSLFLEQLIIKRELAFNFVNYNSNYDNFDKAIPAWAVKSLLDSQVDKRTCFYTKQQLEKCETRDKYWNSAQVELLHYGNNLLLLIKILILFY